MDLAGFICHESTMKSFIRTTIIFSLLVSATAKPGEPYVLTGREKSIFGISQADMKAYPALYRDEDINAYYKAFKALNKLNDGRKLQRGEELMFPHTKRSQEIEAAEKAKAARAAAEAEAAAAREREKEAADNPEGSESSEDQLSVFGSDSRSRTSSADAAAAKNARTAAQRKEARQSAVYNFQRRLLPRWLQDHSSNFVENIDVLVAKARAHVDEPFAGALTLHCYPDKEIHVLEFETPEKVEQYFFLAIKGGGDSEPSLYALEKGISFFGAGDVSKLFERKPGGAFCELGGRKYDDLSGFLPELEAGPAADSAAD